MVIIPTKVPKNRFLRFQQLTPYLSPVPHRFQEPGTGTRNHLEPTWNQPKTPPDLQGTKEPVICNLPRPRNSTPHPKGNRMTPNLEDSHNTVARIYNRHTQETLERIPSPDPVHHLVDAVLTLATVIHMQSETRQ